MDFGRLIVVLVTLTTCSHALAAAASKLVVTVNKTRITEGDLQFLYLSRRVPPDRQLAVRERFINNLIERTLLREYLAGKVKVSDQLIDRYVARIEGVIKRDGKKLDDVLKSMGYTSQSFRAEIAGPLAWDRHARLAITDGAIKKFWDANRSKYDGTEVTASQIVKRVGKDATDQDVITLFAKLANIRQSVLSGDASFSKAATQHSDSPTASKGGNLGTFPFSGNMPQEISRVAFNLKSGEVSEPFKTRFGVHILTVTKIESGTLSLEDARKEIIEHLSSEMRKRLVAGLKEKATISYPAQ